MAHCQWKRPDNSDISPENSPNGALFALLLLGWIFRLELFGFPSFHFNQQKVKLFAGGSTAPKFLMVAHGKPCCAPQQVLREISILWSSSLWEDHTLHVDGQLIRRRLPLKWSWV